MKRILILIEDFHFLYELLPTVICSFAIMSQWHPTSSSDCYTYYVHNEILLMLSWLIIYRSSWVKTGKARCQLKDSQQQFDDCTLELEWVGSDKGCLDSGTLSILSLDKKHTKVKLQKFILYLHCYWSEIIEVFHDTYLFQQMQFSLSEITCVVCCSEPSKPRIAIHTPKLT